MGRKLLPELIIEIHQIAARLRSMEVGIELRQVGNGLASALRAGVLSIAGLLDDSVSNRELGSVFDFRSRSPLNQMRRNFASAYGVRESVPGTNGTTALNVPAVMTLGGEGDEIAIGRDAHVSVPAGLNLSGARPRYITPYYNAELGILLPPTPEEVRRFLIGNPGVRAVWLTLPTYHGIQGDIDGIVKVCHEFKVLAAIDEAHGPHLKFLGELGFPACAEEAGADLITQSTHKVLSALNQGSLIHINSPELFHRYEELQSLGFVSTSFSYLILTSIEHAVNQMLTCGRKIWARPVELAARLRDAGGAMPGVRVVDAGVVDGVRVTGLDPTRVTFNVSGTGLSGFEVEDYIFRMGGVVEMATPEAVLFLVAPGVSVAKMEATIPALREALQQAPRRRDRAHFVPPPIPAQVMTPREATMLGRRERVSVRNAIGRVSAETISCYPPGQAIIIAGEAVTKETIEYLTYAVDAGAHLKRVRDDNFKTMEVIGDQRTSTIPSGSQR